MSKSNQSVHGFWIHTVKPVILYYFSNLTGGGGKTVRRSGLMVSALDSRSSGPGSGHGRGHCFLFLGKTLYSHGASLHPGV